MGDQGKGPNISRGGVRTSHSVQISSGVEEFVTVGKNEFAGVLISWVVLIYEAKIGHTEDGGQVGIVVEAVTTCSVDLVGKDILTVLTYYPVFEDRLFDAFGIGNHLF